MKWLLGNVEREFAANEVENAVNQFREDSINLKSSQWYHLALSSIDLTTLQSYDSQQSVAVFAQKAADFRDHFAELPNVAAVCVYPNFVETVRKAIPQGAIKIASVAGGFPSSQTFTEIKQLEITKAVEAGADEIDIVLNLGNFFDGNINAVSQEIALLKKSCGQAHLKVILESGLLKDPSKIYKAAFISMQSGADFIKTSTGKLEPAATHEAAYVMCLAIRDFYEKSNIKVGFKAAGGIVEPEDALIYLSIVKNVLGEQWLSPTLFRIGASRLANNLLTAIKGEKVSYF